MKVMALATWVVLAVSGTASAQTPFVTRGFIVVNGAYQITTNNFNNSAVKRVNAEDGRLEAKYVVKGAPAFDIAGGGMVWRHLGVGIGVSRVSVATPVSVNGSVPHPFFFNRLRPVSGDASGLKREELAVHVQARAALPIGSRLQAMLFGGPSFFQVKQGVVTDFTYTDSYPYDDARFTSATTTGARVSKMGFNAGGDVAFFFTRQVGVGGTVQYAATTVGLPVAGGATQDVKVGGVRAGAGLRLRF